MRSVVPWSWSSYSAYDTCPRRFYEVKIAKTVVEEESDEILWGNTVHKALENRIKDGTPLPPAMSKFNRYSEQIARSPGDKYPELELAVTLALEPTAFDAPDAWARGVGDIVIINGRKAFAGDYKTGKVKPKSQQLDLMAVLTLANFPEIQELSTTFLWLQFGTLTNKTYNRADAEQIWDVFRQGVREMEWSERNNTWPAKPSGLCRAWCPVLSCPHNGKRK